MLPTTCVVSNDTLAAADAVRPVAALYPNPASSKESLDLEETTPEPPLPQEFIWLASRLL